MCGRTGTHEFITRQIIASGCLSSHPLADCCTIFQYRSTTLRIRRLSWQERLARREASLHAAGVDMVNTDDLGGLSGRPHS